LCCGFAYGAVAQIALTVTLQLLLLGSS